jgi:hypothetical protein
MPIRITFWRRKQKHAPAEAPEPEVPPAPPPPRTGPFHAAWSALTAAFAALDRGLCAFAIPFGVLVADPRKRYAIMLSAFAVIYVLGALPIRIVPLVALAVGYVGVLAIGRAWVLNEKERTAISKKLIDADPDALPDLRWTALVSALQLLILFPLLFLQLQKHFHLYKAPEDATFLDWVWFSLDKTYLKALPDWTMLYGIHHSSIDFDALWGRHLVLLSRLTFDWILIQGAIRILAIRATISEAVAAIKADPDMAVRVGRRAIPSLIEKLSDPDRAVRGAAANALMQLGDPHAIQRITEAAKT